jgi:hypothetical protein
MFGRVTMTILHIERVDMNPPTKRTREHMNFDGRGPHIHVRRRWKNLTQEQYYVPEAQ